MAFTKWLFEEVGVGMNKYLEVEIEYDYELPEPRTYDYPGSPGGSEPTSVNVIELGIDGEPINNFGSWEKSINKIAMAMVEANWYEISESIGRSYIDYKEACEEAKYAAYRENDF